MAEIIPAIISQTFGEIKEKIAQVDGLADWAQLDIMDGLFVQPYSWQTPDELKEIGGKIKIEAHLMIEQPELVLRDWLDSVDRVIVHYEATEHLEEIVSAASGLSVKIGLALNLETPIEVIEKYKEEISYVQLMSIEKIGYQGQKFDERVLSKISALRKKFPSVTISVDGGVNLETAKEAVKAGADVLVVGSALWNSADIEIALAEFKNL